MRTRGIDSSHGLVPQPWAEPTYAWNASNLKRLRPDQSFFDAATLKFGKVKCAASSPRHFCMKTLAVELLGCTRSQVCQTADDLRSSSLSAWGEQGTPRRAPAWALESFVAHQRLDLLKDAVVAGICAAKDEQYATGSQRGGQLPNLVAETICHGRGCSGDCTTR